MCYSGTIRRYERRINLYRHGRRFMTAPYKLIKDRMIPRGTGSILHHCLRCGYDWSSDLQRPSSCPRCCNDRWFVPRGTRLAPYFPCLCLKCGHQWNGQTIHPAKCPECTHFFWCKPPNLRSKDLFNNLLSQETNDCVVWPRSVLRDGYGRLRMGKKTVQVHRLAYETRHGAIPENQKVCHECDNPPCMNYRHLFLGTVADNNTDKVLKKRHRYGNSHPKAKLTEELVREIRAKYVRDYSNRDKRQLHLAEEYGVEQSAISSIIRRVTWKHVE